MPIADRVAKRAQSCCGKLIFYRLCHSPIFLGQKRLKQRLLRRSLISGQSLRRLKTRWPI
jgi:hypothetical protein